MSEVIVLVTGGFDPIHSGHILYLKDAKKLGDKLIVGVNSDQWLIRKKGKFFMPLSERLIITRSLQDIDMKAIAEEINFDFSFFATADTRTQAEDWFGDYQERSFDDFGRELESTFERNLLSKYSTYTNADSLSNLTGTADNDTLAGGDAKETIFGKKGDDTITGGGGDDVIFGYWQRQWLWRRSDFADS